MTPAAPGAALVLVCVADELDLVQAVDWAIANGVDVVNHSVVWFNSSRGDGAGAGTTPEGQVARADANGILWVNAAGNLAEKHWSGTFADADGDAFHDFAAGDRGNDLPFLDRPTRYCAALKWDDWQAASRNDFDLHLVRASDGVSVAWSTNDQRTGAPPTELLCHDAADSGHFVAIKRVAGTGAPRFDLFSMLAGRLQYAVAAGSIAEPATSPHALAFGATCWQSGGLESFSSRGPTIDGRVKPDLVAPDSVSSASFGPFTACATSGFVGTSAAAPHVAAAAALAAAETGLSARSLRPYLEGHALDLGAGGKDDAYGFGRLRLPTSPPTVADVAADPVDNHSATLRGRVWANGAPA